MQEKTSLGNQYRLLERNVLLLIILPLPFFAFAYLYTTSRTRTIYVPEFPGFLDPLFLALALGLLAYQQIYFQSTIRKIKESNQGIRDIFDRYAKATITRYWLLLVVGFICAAGLMLYENMGFTIGYAITLVMISVAKPSPIRMVNLFHLKGEDRDLMMNINRME